jgi:hypothetical protein
VAAKSLLPTASEAQSFPHRDALLKSPYPYKREIRERKCQENMENLQNRTTRPQTSANYLSIRNTFFFALRTLSYLGEQSNALRVNCR